MVALVSAPVVRKAMGSNQQLDRADGLRNRLIGLLLPASVVFFAAALDLRLARRCCFYYWNWLLWTFCLRCVRSFRRLELKLDAAKQSCKVANWPKRKHYHTLAQHWSITDTHTHNHTKQTSR